MGSDPVSDDTLNLTTVQDTPSGDVIVSTGLESQPVKRRATQIRKEVFMGFDSLRDLGEKAGRHSPVTVGVG